MAFSNDQNISKIPAGETDDRQSTDFLPRYFRTSTNQKFLSATIDQMISKGGIDKINAFIGRTTASAYRPTDNYLEDVSLERKNYQLEPAVLLKDDLDNVNFYSDYNDYINQLKFFNSAADDHSKINSQEFYSWDPHIDWDKFVNYREYFWLPSGPQPIAVAGQDVEITSTYTVRIENDGNNDAYVFTPDGLTRNPTLRLYRGQTYRFEIDTPNHPMAFSTTRQFIPSNSIIISTASGIEQGGAYDVKAYDVSDFDIGAWIYNTQVIESISESKNFYDIWNLGVTSATTYVEKGVIEFTIPENAPNILYYVSKNNINTSGFFKIYDISEATKIDVEREIIGKKTYVLRDGTPLSNGMKIYFQGLVTPEKYSQGYWYVEGVGSEIRLVNEKDLELPAVFTANENIEFDNEKFDSQGFDVNNNYPRNKDYLVINRSSKDKNPWSRYNRWFHRDVIETSSRLNDLPIDIDQRSRAVRPIIEFEPDLQLWKFGRTSKENVDLVDDFTQDVFSTIEGSFGYNVDGVQLIPGLRILFTADTDRTVNGRIYRVESLIHLGTRRLTLIPEDDSEPVEGETVLVLSGEQNQGKSFYYDGSFWRLCQQKEKINQPPLFDVFRNDGISFGDKNYYPGTTFNGSAVFTYRPGSNIDKELGFGIAYRNILNVGDIVFDFNFHSDEFQYQDLSLVKTIKIDQGYLRSNKNGVSSHVNGWKKAVEDSFQSVIRQYDVDTSTNFFEIDVYENSGQLTDLEVSVHVNNKKQGLTDYEIFRQDRKAYVRFFENLKENDVLIIKTRSSSKKTNQGFYEFPANLENNPENINTENFTLGEIIEHVRSISNSFSGFVGDTPGPSNLRDLGSVTEYGKKIIQHSGPLLPVIFHITNKEYNIINALRYAKSEYSKFKRNFIKTITDFGYDGITRIHLDLIMKELCKDKNNQNPFYFSDMVPTSGEFIFDQEVIDDSIVEYPLIFDFDLTKPSEKSVLVYLNEEQLLSSKDYEFIDGNFIRILTSIRTGDNLKIIQYENTDGCFVPPTPSKFGIYPLFEPKIYIDDTFLNPIKVIQGHDGSVTIAFNDYRDDLILEFEKRIFNNVKISYDKNFFNIHDFITGYYRKTDISKEELDSTLRQEFLNWSRLIAEDYTEHNFFDRNNRFTFNYKQFSSPNGETVRGFWRGIYKDVYDTDRPHSHPWEILGFEIKPLWWETVYGPAPYTSDNLVLWRDIESGTIREPNKSPTINLKYARPSILKHLPVDQQGNLLTPLDSDFIQNYVSVFSEGAFEFGDQSPIESTWRRHSEYPFALIIALLLLRPAKIFSKCFDRVNQYKDDTSQIITRFADLEIGRFNMKSIVFPNTATDNVRSFTGGFVNYMIDYLSSKSSDLIESYKKSLTSARVNLGMKLGGFSTKEKFKLILDSRTPLNQGNVFIPEENYNIILNTSSPTFKAIYSGVIIEKSSSGFIIQGYNQQTPEFRYKVAQSTTSDPVINIGGISEDFLLWSPGKTYNRGQIVNYDQSYFRVVTSHESLTSFDEKFYAKLPSLPSKGGREIILRKRFLDRENTLSYGSKLSTIQEVVDFLLGYEKYLEQQGFVFNYYNSELGTITDWKTSAREFAFWTTQNWAEGTVISLSPAADELSFQKEYSVVDNIYDNFYNYSIFKQDGTVLEPSFTNSIRKKNEYSLRPINTADGIYHAELNLVQKEHVLILDNLSIFGDVLYDQSQGYRQERIRLLGYRTNGWNGDFDVASFLYDLAEVTEWRTWKDYALGDTVKYKEFYYSAKNNVPGSDEFDFSKWYRLEKKPESRLIENWDYQANQFLDFYDLDSDNFNSEQQKLAQHLIGYQSRPYLENIINDPVSQYKFYQGMLQEKGSRNSFNKLFDVLSSLDKDSLEFYEEWAIRTGRYGATDVFDEIEYKIDESKFLVNPQIFELATSIDPTANDFVYRIKSNEVYLKPDNYNHSPIPVTVDLENYVNTSGYVNFEDVNYILGSKDELVNFDIKNLREGDYFWLTFDSKTLWNVLRFTLFSRKIESVELSNENLRITFKTNLDPAIKVNEYIGISGSANSLLDGIFKVTGISFNWLEISKPENITDDDISAINEDKKINFFKFSTNRLTNFDDLNSLSIPALKQNETIWVDGIDNQWAVWKYRSSYSKTNVEEASRNQFSKVLTVSRDETIMAAKSDNSVLYYIRPDSNFQWEFKATLTASSKALDDIDPDYNNVNNSFGNSIAFSSNGNDLFIGAPEYGTDRTGYVAHYVRDLNNFFNLENVIDYKNLIPSYQGKEKFGYDIRASNNILFVASKGDSVLGVNPSVMAYDFKTKSLLDIFYFRPGVEINEIGLSSSDTIIASTTDDVVHLINFNGGVFQDSTLHSEISLGDINKEILVSKFINNNYKFVGTWGLNGRQKKEYLVNDVYEYQNNIYVCLQTHESTINDPKQPNVNSSLWKPIFWKAETEYQKNDKIIFNKFIYEARRDNIGQQPDLNQDDWKILKYNFGKSVDISQDNTTIAIGLTDYSDLEINQGAVILFNFEDNEYKSSELIVSYTAQEAERFGSRVRFDISGSKLVIYGRGGNQYFETSFDSKTMTLDLGATPIIDVVNFAGSIKIYDRYEKKYLYSDQIFEDNILGGNFGDNFVVLKNIFINDPVSESGIVHEYQRKNKSWIKDKFFTSVVDTNKIKSIFLYNDQTKKIVEYLDFVDPIQGKILGIAEQELNFKTFFDPAVYSNGVDEVVVDPLKPWLFENVGKLWWDLSTTKFADPYQGSVVYKANSWNTLSEGASIDVYEWVESQYSPSEWDQIADTEEGLNQGISGRSKYGDQIFSTKKVYDNIRGSFKNTYYFWVKNKTVVPNIESRRISAKEVSDLIADPKSKGVAFISLLGKNQFALFNCNNLIVDSDIILNFRFWNNSNKDNNIHYHYQLMSESESSKTLNRYVEQKWFDSLIGVDVLGRQVPDNKLPEKLKYGILNKPRQSMFINRIEALKQFVERANQSLMKRILIDDYDLSHLFAKEDQPLEILGKYDIAIQTFSELRFIGKVNNRQAKLSLDIRSGKIQSVRIIDSGNGYKIAPEISIKGPGSGAKLTAEINEQGQIFNVIVEKSGNGYIQDSTSAIVRPFTVLVETDETSNGKWSLYTYNLVKNLWEKVRVQTFDTTKFWEYIDWYQEGYNKFTSINYIVDYSYQVLFLDMKAKETVKINNQGNGWLILEKITNLPSRSLSTDYRIIARQNGTIQLKENLYRYIQSNIGFDGPTFDADFYDDRPDEELRIILNCLKNNIFVDELSIEFNKLFFSSLRYVFSEQKLVDWAFKTSFVKAKHNLGLLKQKINYQNDNLPSYEDYVKEIKPYRTKIREFLSSYESFDQTRTSVTDFDLPSRYDAETDTIKPFSVKVRDGLIEYDSQRILEEPYSDWFYNVGFEIKEILISDPGSEYEVPPVVEIIGSSAEPARATAFIANKRISKIVIDNPGFGYLETPVINLLGSTPGRQAKAVAILGNSLVRNKGIEIKFDRLSRRYEITTLNVKQEFIGSGSQTRFNLRWPVDIRKDSTTVSIDSVELLSSDFTVFNNLDRTSSYERYNGFLVLNQPAPIGAKLVISYKKDINLLSAQDRIKFYYDPSAGQLGKDLSQLMTGVDYGGVTVTGISFGLAAGWDALPWFSSGWDSIDEEFSDYLVISDGSSRTFILPYIPEDGELINVYLNGVRIDDPFFDEYSKIQQELLAAQAIYQNLVDQLEILGQQLVTSVNEVNLINAELESKQVELEQKEQEFAATPPEDPNFLILEAQVITLREEVNELTAQLNSAVSNRISIESQITIKTNQRTQAFLDLSSKTQIFNNTEPLTNKNAIMNTFVGDGSTNVIMLPSSAAFLGDQTPNNIDDRIIFRKSTSDGSFLPKTTLFDTSVIGGDFSYSTASGIAAEDINIDGDGFVTPDTSYAPEEVVPGQIVESVNIIVYDKPSDGSPIILSRHYTVKDSLILEYGIGQQVFNSKSVFVLINGNILKFNEEYSVNVSQQTITALIPLNVNDLITVISMSANSQDILDLQYFESDGISTEFVTPARWDRDFRILVTIDGEPAAFETFKTDESYDRPFNIGFRLFSPPDQGKIISYIVINSLVDTVSRVERQTLIHDGSTEVYELANIPFNLKPSDNNVLVITDGKVLKPRDTLYFTVRGSSRKFSVPRSDYAVNTIDPSQIKVYINGILKVISRDFFWTSATGELTIKPNIANEGDVIALTIFRSDVLEYEINENLNTIRFYDSYPAGTEITVVTFSNHDILETERNLYYTSSASVLTPGTVDYYKFNNLLSGRIELRREALGSSYVWAVLNNTLLTPLVDYILDADKKHIKLNPSFKLDNDSYIEIITLASDVIKPAFAYSIFKDMLNRKIYKRIDDSITTTLAKELNNFDTSIELVDASRFSEPFVIRNVPGIIFIDGERIEYLKKDGNILSQLRRGTLGTGIKNRYDIGTKVRDQSNPQTIPYKDEEIEVVLISSGFNSGSQFYRNSPGVSVTSITYDFNNTTAFPLGGQICTVKGTGFRNDLEVYVGDPTLIQNLTVTESTTDNQLVVNSIDRLYIGKEIKFSGNVFAGLEESKPYYIISAEKEQSTERLLITISETPVGENSPTFPVPLTAEFGTMTGSHLKSKCKSTYVSSTELTFLTQAEVIGAYDLIIVNPEIIVDEVRIRSTSIVVPEAIKYVQILLPFAPLPNPRTATNWYKKTRIISVTQIQPGRGYIINSRGNTDFTSIGASSNFNGTEFIATSVGTGTGTVIDFPSIPYEYWEALDIDVFVGGKRLIKTPLKVFNENLGPDSPTGDEDKEADFAVNRNVGAYVRLTKPPPIGSKVIVRKTIGKIWTDLKVVPATSMIPGQRYIIQDSTDVDFTTLGSTSNEPGTVFTATSPALSGSATVKSFESLQLADSNSKQAQFIRSTYADLPR